MPKPQLTQDIMHHFEESARALRAKAGVGPYEPFDPFSLLAELGVVLKYPDELTNLPEALLTEMNSLDAKAWSGMGNELPTGKLLVVLNRHQTPERARVTLLEEVAHHYHGHIPVGIGLSGRTLSGDGSSCVRTRDQGRGVPALTPLPLGLTALTERLRADL